MKKISYVQALLWIVGSALVIPGATYKTVRWSAPTFLQSREPAALRRIVQTGPQREALKTAYLAELIGLSSDKPVLAKNFDVARAEARLAGIPRYPARDREAFAIRHHLYRLHC